MYLDNVYSRSKLFTSAFTFSLHSTSKHLFSFCFFYKADVRLCQDSFPLLPFKINPYFFPFSWLRACEPDGHTSCCTSFDGDGEKLKPCLEHTAALVLLPQPRHRPAELTAALLQHTQPPEPTGAAATWGWLLPTP